MSNWWFILICVISACTVCAQNLPVPNSDKSPPMADNLVISGQFDQLGVSGASAEVGYLYLDANEDAEKNSKYEWFVAPPTIVTLDCWQNPVCIRIADESYGEDDSNPRLALSTHSPGWPINLVGSPFEHLSELAGLKLVFCVTPRSEFEEGYPRCVISDRNLAMGAVEPPQALDITITPNEHITQLSTLVGNYTFIAAEGALEGSSRATWRNKEGVIIATQEPVTEQTSLRLPLYSVMDPEQVTGHQLQLCITPVTQDEITGNTACSGLTDVITAEPNFYLGCGDGLLYDPLQDLTFTCPLTSSEAERFNIKFQEEYIEGDPIFGPVGIPFVLMNWLSADSYCNALVAAGYDDWYLPDSSALFNLWDNMDGVDEHPPASSIVTEHGWPVTHGYWSNTAYDHDIHYAIGLFVFFVEHIKDSNSTYVSCIRQGRI